ncbi:hypothetical protein CRV24_002512 [Beauveria bassiana]|nr:hypothetical protein CRV24_002512 [Beauveria bassiana]
MTSCSCDLPGGVFLFFLSSDQDLTCKDIVLSTAAPLLSDKVPKSNVFSKIETRRKNMHGLMQHGYVPGCARLFISTLFAVPAVCATEVWRVSGGRQNFTAQPNGLTPLNAGTSRIFTRCGAADGTERDRKGQREKGEWNGEDHATWLMDATELRASGDLCAPFPMRASKVGCRQ